MCSDVCSDEGANASRWLQHPQHWYAYALPPGILSLRGAARRGDSTGERATWCAQPPSELGVDGALLPVTSVWTQRKAIAGGMWLYYARGCSDFGWSAGKTLLAKNRCDAAIELQRRVQLARSHGSRRPSSNSDAHQTERAADSRSAIPPTGEMTSQHHSSPSLLLEAARVTAAKYVAEWLTTGRNLPYMSHRVVLSTARQQISSVLGRNLSLAEALLECARGIYETSPVDCHEALAAPPAHHTASSTAQHRLPRAAALSALAGHDLLDLHNAAALRNLSSRYVSRASMRNATKSLGPDSSSRHERDMEREGEPGRPFDTIQLWQQPQGGGKLTWTSEIWDGRRHGQMRDSQLTFLVHCTSTRSLLDRHVALLHSLFAQCGISTYPSGISRAWQ